MCVFRTMAISQSYQDVLGEVSRLHSAVRCQAELMRRLRERPLLRRGQSLHSARSDTYAFTRGSLVTLHIFDLSDMCILRRLKAKKTTLAGRRLSVNACSLHHRSSSCPVSPPKAQLFNGLKPIHCFILILNMYIFNINLVMKRLVNVSCTYYRLHYISHVT